MLEEAMANAMKRVISWQMAQVMKAQQLTKTALAKRMHTSPASIDCFLVENDSSLTLSTLAIATCRLPHCATRSISSWLEPDDCDIAAILSEPILARQSAGARTCTA